MLQTILKRSQHRQLIPVKRMKQRLKKSIAQGLALEHPDRSPWRALSAGDRSVIDPLRLKRHLPVKVQTLYEPEIDGWFVVGSVFRCNLKFRTH